MVVYVGWWGFLVVGVFCQRSNSWTCLLGGVVW